LGGLLDGGLAGLNDTKPISAAFGSSVAFVIDRLEGGELLVNDTGGPTRWGISKRAHPNVDVSKLTRDQALDIYHASYWSPLKADALPRGLDLLLFDAGVNMGVGFAAKLLQRVLKIKEDGVVGPETIAAAKSFRPQSELRALLNGIRLRTYEELARSKPVYTQYMNGWRLRVLRLADESGRIGGAA
jgi:lysozyme family protein